MVYVWSALMGIALCYLFMLIALLDKPMFMVWTLFGLAILFVVAVLIVLFSEV